MTIEELRDQFAAQAMQSLIIISNAYIPQFGVEKASLLRYVENEGWGGESPVPCVGDDGMDIEGFSIADSLALDAYVIADAMIRRKLENEKHRT